MATQLTFRSELQASPEEAWQWATPLSGVSTELRAIMRMSAPKGLRSMHPRRASPFGLALPPAVFGASVRSDASVSASDHRRRLPRMRSAGVPRMRETSQLVSGSSLMRLRASSRSIERPATNVRNIARFSGRIAFGSRQRETKARASLNRQPRSASTTKSWPPGRSTRTHSARPLL